MRYLKLILIIAIVFTLFTSCTRYRYGDQTFTDRSKAETAYKEDIAKMSAAIQPRKTPLAKYAKVIIPDKNILLERAVIGGTSESRDYLATYFLDQTQAIGEMIRKRNIFEKVDINYTSDPGHVTPKSNEVLIYFYIPDRKTGGWYYISDKTKRTPVHFDRGNPDLVEK